MAHDSLIKDHDYIQPNAIGGTSETVLSSKRYVCDRFYQDIQRSEFFVRLDHSAPNNLAVLS